MSLAQTLGATLAADPAIRQEAERQLTQWHKQDTSVIIQALDVIVDAEQSNAVRQAASLFVKNGAFDLWGSKPEFHGERSRLREQIVRTMVGAPPQSSSTLSTIVSYLINADPFPYAWPDLLPQVERLLDTSTRDVSAHELYVGLLVLIEVLRHYRWAMGGSQSLDQVVHMFFPRILELGQRMVSADPTGNDSAGDVLWKILKAYKIAVEGELPPYLQQQEQVEGWVSLFLTIVTKNPVHATSRGWEKCHKWAMLNINKLFLWYAVVPDDDVHMSATRLNLSDYYSPFSSMFITHFAPEITRQLIRVQTTLADIDPSEAPFTATLFTREIFLYLEKCVRVDTLWSLVLANLEVLLSKCVFRTMLLSDEDLSMFAYEPEQYTQSQFADVVRDEPLALTPQMAARLFITALGKIRGPETLNGLMLFVSSIVTSEGTEKGQALNRDCAMQILGAVARSVTGDHESAAISFIASYGLNDLQSKYAFLRGRACNLVSHYASHQSLNADVLQQVYKGIVQCTGDQSVVVKIQAILALRSLLQIDVIRETHAESVSDTIQRVLDLYNSDAGTEALSTVLDDLVVMYSDKLVPFASSLTRQLTAQFHRIFQELQECPESDFTAIDEKIGVAQNVLGTILTLLGALEDYPSALAEIESDAASILSSVFDKAEVSLYPEAVDILDGLLTSNRPISATLWHLLDQLSHLFESDPETYIDELIPSLDRYVEISRILKSLDDWTAERLMFLVRVATYSLESDVQPVTEKNAACLAQHMLLVLPMGSLNVSNLVRAAFMRQEHQQCFNVILAFIYSNANEALTLLRGDIPFEAVLQRLITQYRASTNYERKLAALTICRLLSLPDGELSVEQIVLLRKKLLLIAGPENNSSNVGTPQLPQTQFSFVSEFSHDQFAEDNEPLPTLEDVLSDVAPESLYVVAMEHLSRRPDVASALQGSLAEHEQAAHAALMARN